MFNYNLKSMQLLIILLKIMEMLIELNKLGKYR
jgi:hypothetical protein